MYVNQIHVGWVDEEKEENTNSPNREKGKTA